MVGSPYICRRRGATQALSGLDPELLALVPKPVSAVLLIFPSSQAVDDSRTSDDSTPEPHPDIIYIKQKVRLLKTPPLFFQKLSVSR